MRSLKYVSLSSVACVLMGVVGCGGESPLDVGSVGQPLYGAFVSVEMSKTEGYSAATAAIFTSANNPANPNEDYFTCSGTLVNRRRIVTALHCVQSGAAFTRVRFPQRGGLDVKVVETKVPTGAKPSVKSSVSSTDIAVLVLAEDVPRWIAEPIPMRMDDAHAVFDGTPGRYGLMAGFGGTVVYSSGAGNDGNRRIGKAPADWNGKFWEVGELSPGTHSVAASGDSGGGLFRQYSAQQFELVGVCSAWHIERSQGLFYDDTVYYSAYAPTGNQSATFTQSLADALAYIPIDPGPVFELRDIAVYGKYAVSINDRATVQNPGGSYAKVAAGGSWGIDYDSADLVIGADAKVGEVWVDDNVSVRDRGVTGNIVTEGRLIGGQGIATGTVTEHTRTTMPPFALPAWPAAATQLPAQTVSGPVDLTEAAGTVVYGKIIVNNGGVLTLKPSTKPYYIQSLQVEPGGKVLVDTSAGPQRIFIADSFLYRGQLSDTHGTVRGDILIGVYGNSPVSIEKPIVATVVAPNTSLTLDDYGKRFEGAFLGATVTVHQGIQVLHQPFPANW